jgi:hypothetical protein
MKVPKLLVPDIADRACFALDAEGRYAFGSGYGIILKEEAGVCPKYALAVCNSRALEFFVRQVSTPLRGGFFRYFAHYIEQLPIPEACGDDQAMIGRLADGLAYLSKQAHREGAGGGGIRDLLDAWVNALVYELFFPEECRARELRFLEATRRLAPPEMAGLVEQEQEKRLVALAKSAAENPVGLLGMLARIRGIEAIDYIERAVFRHGREST